MTDMAYMARRPYSSTLGSLAHATVSMVFYGEDLEISNTGNRDVTETEPTEKLSQAFFANTDEWWDKRNNKKAWLKSPAAVVFVLYN
ncbi:hypothetical protein LXL04_015571 [Taraxacum kok-saghyz]